MLVISRWLVTRFLRLRLHLLALFLPLIVFLGARFGGGGEPAFAYAFLLGLFLYLLPVVAVVFTLSSVDRAQWDLFLSRPLHPAGLLAGTWLGTVIPFWLCQLALVLAALLVGVLAGAPGDSARDGRVYADDVAVYRGEPGQPWPRPENDPAAARTWLESLRPWTFEVGGLRGEDLRGAAAGGVEAFLVAEVGRFVESGQRHTAAIYRASTVHAEVVFHGLDEGDPRRRREIELENGKAVELSIPLDAIREDGSLALGIARVEGTEDPPGEREDGVLLRHDHREHDHEGGTPRQNAPATASEPSETVGESFFWFENRRDPNGKRLSGLLVVRDRIGFLWNFLRASLQAAALIPLLAALTTFAAALFSRPVAFALVLTLFVCGSSMVFLSDVVESLELRSASFAFGAVARPPTVLDAALRHFLAFWIFVLPDFDRMRGGPWLVSGDAIRWLTILEAQAIAALYTAILLLPTSLVLRRWEVAR